MCRRGLHAAARPGPPDPGQRNRTWLLMLAKYRALNARRRLSRHPAAAPEHPGPASGPAADPVLDRERQEAWALAISQLDPAGRAVVIRRYLLGMSIKDIAQEMGLARSAVDNRLARGRRKLRQQWTTQDEGGNLFGNTGSR